VSWQCGKCLGNLTSVLAQLELRSTTDLQVLRNNTEATTAVGADIADGTWHHVAVAFSAATGVCTLLLDGRTLLAASLQAGGALEAEANLIIGQWPVYGATSERQRRREGVEQEVQQPYNLSQTDGRVYRVCAAEKPTQGCDIFHFEQLWSTYVWSLDNDKVLQRGSDPEAHMVTPGAWRCAFEVRAALCAHKALRR
jgi:hypothetical protein